VSKASLRFASDLLRRLGEELTPSPVNGIIELAKNAYDADASVCRIALVQASDKEYGVLSVVDDGDGMTPADLRDGWLVLGRSRKDTSTPTGRGRVPVGDKGLGRLAALRMGTKVTVETCAKVDPERVHTLVIDWEKFDGTAEPQQVELQIRTKRRKEEVPGTAIRVEGIGNALSLEELRRLNRGLLLINNPFLLGNRSFETELEITPRPARPLPTLSSLFKSAQYRIEAGANKGSLRAKLFDIDNKVLFEATDKELTDKMSSDLRRHVPSLNFKLWIYILQSQEFEGGHAELIAVRKWLVEFGGVHVFLDHVRVAPYGDPGDDWVGMNALRAANPELMPQTGTAIGYVELRSTGKMLRQKTDRSGFLESDATAAIRDFARATLKWQQSKRLLLRVKQETKETGKAEKDSKKAFENLIALAEKIGGEKGENAKSLVVLAQRSAAQMETHLRREVELFRTLGTAGIAASVFAHEATQNPLARIKSNAKSVGFRVKKYDAKFFDNQISQAISRILEDVSGLSSVSAVTLSLVRARKRTKQVIDVGECVAEIVNLFSKFFETHGIACELKVGKGSNSIFGARSSLESVVVNLLTNSVQAFEKASVDCREIEISVNGNGAFVEVRVEDSGPGIKNISLREMWLPGETTREEGTGLGLTIVASAVRDLGGKVSAVANGAKGGASFSLQLPGLPK